MSFEKTSHGTAHVGSSRRIRKNLVSNGFVLLVADTLMLFLGLFIGDALLERLRGIPMHLDRGLLIIPGWWAGAIVMRIAPGWGVSPVDLLRRCEVLLAGLFGLVLLAAFLLRIGPELSRIMLLIAYAFSAFGIPLARALARALMIRGGHWGVAAVVYGRGESVGQVVQAMQEEPGLGYRPVGIFGDPGTGQGAGGGVPVLGTMKDSNADACVAILAMEDVPPADIRPLLDNLLVRYPKIVLLSQLREIPSIYVRPQDFLGLLGLEIIDNLANPLARLVKRSLDILIVIVTLPLWLPLIGLIAVLVWLEDRGPAFYRQERIGHGKKTFKVVKFRTMHVDAERLLEARLQEDTELRTYWEKNCKIKEDPRITRIGRLLRMTSLDELPQLFNVLGGSMALVGPRPLPAYHNDKLSAIVQGLREEVLPGITGMWQVSGRSDSGTAGMERWDAYYVRNWSVWLDLIILGRTVGIVLSGRGAY